NSVDRWFNAPMAEVLTSARDIAGEYYGEQQRLVAEQAQEFARALTDVDLKPEAVRDIVAGDVLNSRNRIVEVFRVEGARVAPVFDVAALARPAGYSRATSARLAERTAAGSTDTRLNERLPQGEVIHTAMPIRAPGGGAIRGVVISSEYLTGQLAD